MKSKSVTYWPAASRIRLDIHWTVPPVRPAIVLASCRDSVSQRGVGRREFNTRCRSRFFEQSRHIAAVAVDLHETPLRRGHDVGLEIDTLIFSRRRPHEDGKTAVG